MVLRARIMERLADAGAEDELRREVFMCGIFSQVDVLLGQICAENELSKARLARQLPNVGDSTVACEQAGQAFDVAVQVRPTPNPQFRRIDAQVLRAGSPVLSLTTIVGRY